MNTIWILVVNQAEAQVYSAKNLPGKIAMVGIMTHAEGTARTRDLVSDTPGRAYDSRGEGRHAMEPDVGVKEEERRKFIKEVVNRLEAAQLRKSYDRLVVLAAPAVLGVFRKTIGDSLSRLVIREIPKDVVGQSVEKIETQLRKSFELK